MRELVIPANPQTAPQMNVRGAFGGSSKGFKNGTAMFAQEWDEYGATQRSKTGKPLTGIGSYNRLAIVYRLVNPGGTPPASPPTADYLGDGFAITAAAQPNGILFHGGGSTAADSVIEIRLAKLPAGNSKPRFNQYKTFAYATLDAGDGNEYLANVPPGRYACAYRFVNKATGQATELVQLNVLGVTLEIVKGGADEKPQARKKAA